MTTTEADRELPPLPFSPYLVSEWKGPEMIDRIVWTAYNEQQMREYAQAALAYARRNGQENIGG